MAGKITDYTPLTTLSDGDLSDWSNFDEVSAYDSRSVSWADLKTNIQNQITFDNIYTQDGTLTGNRIVSMGVNDLTFGSTGDSNLLKFETTNDRIGIGTATPAEKLTVAGNILQTGATNTTALNNATLTANGFFGVRSGSASGSATVFEGFNSGGAEVFTINNNGCFTSGNLTGTAALLSFGRTYMGIGSGSAGMEFLRFAGNIATASDKVIRFRRETTTEGGIIDLFDGSGNTDVSITGGTGDSYFNGGGNVGIGTATPTKKLDVIGTGVFSDQIGIGTVAPNAATKLHVVSTEAIRLETAIGGGRCAR